MRPSFRSPIFAFAISTALANVSLAQGQSAVSAVAPVASPGAPLLVPPVGGAVVRAASAGAAVVGKGTADKRGDNTASATPKPEAFDIALPTAPKLDVVADEDDEIATDRPDFTETAATIAKGRVQMEAGQTYSKEGGIKSFAIGEMLLRIGLTDRIEARINLASFDMQLGGAAIATGFEDASLGAKISVIREQHGLLPQFAVLGSMSIPSGTRGWRATQSLPEVKLSAAWDITERVAFGTNWNWSKEEDETGGSFNIFAATGSVGVGLTERLGAYFETFALREQSALPATRTYVNGGVTLKLTSEFQLDLRAGRGFGAANGALFTGAGLSHRW